MPEAEPALAVAARTDPGQKRKKNEDAFGYRLTEHGGIFVVADGMGGHAHGDRAARLAVETLLDRLSGRDPSPALLVDALEEANRLIYQTARAERAEGMGTTATVLVVDFPYALLAHVGEEGVGEVHDQHGGGGAHALGPFGAGGLIDEPVRLLERVDQEGGGRVAPAQAVEQRLHRQPGRPVAVGVAAHAVGNDEDPAVFGQAVAKGVLVFLALLTGVGAGGHGQGGFGLGHAPIIRPGPRGTS